MSERARAKELLAKLGMSERRKQVYGEGIDRATETDLASASDGLEEALNNVDAGLATADRILARRRARLGPESVSTNTRSVQVVATLSVRRLNSTPHRLIALVTTHAGDQEVTVYVFDAEHLDPRKDKPVYQTTMVRSKLSDFLKGFIDDDQPSSATQSYSAPRSSEVAFPSVQPNSPKDFDLEIAFKYAAALRIDDQFGQVEITESEPEVTESEPHKWPA
ncbi:MAG: hypothetical protein E6J91_47190 [Deltaproteobacteria bacterium]|nr:MAG: hypothetical protein E6J91_47190 [Deltaproteobacteria bacterium]